MNLNGILIFNFAAFLYCVFIGGVVYGESDGGSSGADTPASGGGLSGPSFVNEKGLRRISHHSIRSTDSEFEVTSQGVCLLLDYLKIKMFEKLIIPLIIK